MEDQISGGGAREEGGNEEGEKELSVQTKVFRAILSYSKIKTDRQSDIQTKLL